jgi:hypothetical protein
MSIYSSIYSNLCIRGCQRKSLYGKGSNLHRHHIIPRHSGGIDAEENYTYLTIREHIIAHFLLWKLYKNPNDLRSMHMLGAELTSNQRKIMGIWCRDNNIGFFGASLEKRNEWRRKGAVSQLQNEIGIFDPKYTKEYAAIGGRAGSRSQIEKGIAIFDPEKRKDWASLGAKSHKGKRCMYKPGDQSFIRVVSSDIENKLSEGYIFGSPHKNAGLKSGCRWMHDNNGHCLQVNCEKISDYISKGYSFGRSRKRI